EGKGILLAEAGTGTGKSLAYLIPAMALRQRVVIATKTKALQDQLCDKDVPLAAEILGQKPYYIKIKGKANYLCLFYYDRFRRNPLFRDPAETDYYSIIEKWAETTQTGEKSELKELPEDLDFLNQINILSERCLFSKCPFFDICFLFRLKRNAEKADLIVTNHHILFADCAIKSKKVGASVLPYFNNLIIDEAHEVEDSATNFFGVNFSKRMAEEWIYDCLREVPKEKHQRKKNAIIDEVDLFFSNFENVSEKRKLKKEEIKRAHNAINHFVSSLSIFHSSLEKKISSEIFLGLYDRLETLKDSLSFILEEDSQNYVRAIEKRNTNIILSASPISVGKLIKEALFSKMKSIILTSATLSVNNSFDYISKRIGVNSECQCVKIESHFSFENQGLFYVPQSFPDPNSDEFLPAAIETIRNLICFSKGRAFILCTSVKNMNAIYDKL
ncbi:MAG: ATP-dependent DNA helicase, partial [Acidobacteria bacterium]|nr:ATP-dependent DNA helicase [Acidobacteriota bacterium]